MSAFIERKLKTYFHRIDFDKDGSITPKDFEGMADRFVAAEKLDAKRGADLRHKLLEIWEKHLKVVAGGNAIKEGPFVDALKKQIKDPAMKATLSGPLPLFFSAVDANGDGQIQEDEFALFFQIFGLDPKMATDSFRAIDTNHDNNLSLDEFVTAGVSFFTSEDESCPTKFFWGPLV